MLVGKVGIREQEVVGRDWRLCYNPNHTPVHFPSLCLPTTPPNPITTRGRGRGRGRVMGMKMEMKE